MPLEKEKKFLGKDEQQLLENFLVFFNSLRIYFYKKFAKYTGKEFQTNKDFQIEAITDFIIENVNLHVFSLYLDEYAGTLSDDWNDEISDKQLSDREKINILIQKLVDDKENGKLFLRALKKFAPYLITENISKLGVNIEVAIKNL